MYAAGFALLLYFSYSWDTAAACKYKHSPCAARGFAVVRRPRADTLFARRRRRRRAFITRAVGRSGRGWTTGDEVAGIDGYGVPAGGAARPASAPRAAIIAADSILAYA